MPIWAYVAERKGEQMANNIERALSETPRKQFNRGQNRIDRKKWLENVKRNSQYWIRELQYQGDFLLQSVEWGNCAHQSPITKERQGEWVKGHLESRDMIIDYLFEYIERAIVGERFILDFFLEAH
jgi:hypothetical protein